MSLTGTEAFINYSLQAGVITGVAGWALSATPPNEGTDVWPHIVFGYGYAASLSPWFFGTTYERKAFPFVLWGITGVPFVLAAYWLNGTPYWYISIMCLGLSIIYGLVAFGNLISHRSREK